MRNGYGLVAMLLCVLMGATSTTASAEQQRMYGRRNPFDVERLPGGRLKRSLETLSPAARTRAMKWLHNFDFPATDAVSSRRVDSQGSGLYVDPAPTEAAAASTPPVAAASPVAITTADAFKLHSKPGATNVLYLDFDGHLITGTAWNAVYGGGLAYDALPYDVDGNPAAFSSSELQNVINVWRRVAEDYAPFNVDVTTQLPASFGSNVARAVITRDADRSGRAMPQQGAAASPTSGSSAIRTSPTTRPRWCTRTASAAGARTMSPRPWRTSSATTWACRTTRPPAAATTAATARARPRGDRSWACPTTAS